MTTASAVIPADNIFSIEAFSRSCVAAMLTLPQPTTTAAPSMAVLSLGTMSTSLGTMPLTSNSSVVDVGSLELRAADENEIDKNVTAHEKRQTRFVERA